MNYNFSPLTKVIKVDERYYGYDAASKLLCELDEDSARYLSSGNIIVAPKPLKRLLEKGVFSTPSFQQCTVSATNIPTMVQYNMEHILPKRFTLEVTESCNLRCKYCFNTIGNRTRVHTQRHMDEDTAFMAIDYYFKCFTEKISKVEISKRKACLQKTKPVFTLWGGEPLLNFELIRKAKAYFDALPWSDWGISKEDFICSIVTNFTIFDDEILHFLKENRILLAISLDGDREVHDNNRIFINGRGSFNIVKANLDRLYSSAPDYCQEHVLFHAVYDGKEALERAQDFFATYLYDTQGNKRFIGVSYLNQSKPKEKMDFSVSPEDEQKSLDLFKKKMAKLSLLSEVDLDKKILSGEVVINDYLSLFDREKKLCFDYPQVSDRCVRTFSCPIGTAQIAVGVKGDIQVCYKSDESYSIGNVHREGVEVSKLIQMYLEYHANFQDCCKQCWAFRFCQKCPSNMLRNGKFIASTEKECEYVRKMAEIGLTKYILFSANEKLYAAIEKYYSHHADGFMYV